MENRQSTILAVADGPPQLEPSDRSRTDWIRRYLLIAQSVSVVSMAAGTLVLLGWILDITVFESVVPGLVAMRPNTAVCFILLGFALWLSSHFGKINLKRKITAQVCALFAAVVGAVTLSERLTGFNTGINDLLFRKELSALNTPFPGRMAHISGLEFFILGTALALLHAKSRRGQRLAQSFALVGTVIGLVVLVGYAFSATALYRISVFSSVALNSALLFTVLGVAILCARPDHGFMSTVTNRNLGGLLARRILPMAFTLPFLIGWLWLQGQNAGLFGTELGLAIFTISNALIFAFLVWLSSRSLNKVDAERQRVTGELQGANEQLRERARVFDLAQVLVRDMDSRILEWNLGAEQLYGFSKKEALGRISHQLFRTQFPEPLAQIEETLLHNGRWKGELVHRKLDGGRLVVSSQWVLHRDSAGCAIRILETNTDITDLQESEERFRTMANSIPQLAWIARADGYIYWYNQRWYEYTGTTPEQMEGWGWQSVHDPLMLLKVLEQYRDSIATGEPFDMEFPLRGSDGLYRRFLTRTLPLKDAEGHVVQWFGTNTDITERKQAEEEIQQLNADLENRVIERTAQLQTSNSELQMQIAEREQIECTLHDQNIELQNVAAAKDQFLANMSHELRTPLNGIIGFAELLVDGKPGDVNPKQKEYLEIILNSGQHLLQLISDVLDLSKVGAGKMELHPERFSLRQAIEEACAVAKPMAEKKFVQIDVYIVPEIGDVTLDQQKFKQVLYNLVSNAIKFNRDGHTVEIRATMHDARCFKLVVKDAGVGIKSKDVSRLFKEFEQLDSGASRRHEGTGLGLALTRKIVELQGGTIGVESEIGKGSSFTVLLPLDMAEVNV
jgi:PAS domain S-box-containing protein